MANPRLNKDRSFGSIMPPTNGAFYEQDGSFFDNSGEYLGDDFDALGSKGAVKAAPAAPAKQTKATKAKDTKPAPPAGEGEEDPTPSSDDLDLAKWAKGEEKYAFFSVKKAVKALYPDADVTNAKTTKTALVEAGVVAYDDVKW